MQLSASDPTIRGRLPPRVLVVDDEPTIGRVVQRILQRWGYIVDVVESGLDAAREIRSFRPQLVLVDLQLGDMDGRELVRQIHAEYGAAAPPIIAITAHAVTDVDGTVGVCNKPFGVTDLVELVHAHTRGRQDFTAPTR